jgi:hypothetical protein
MIWPRFALAGGGVYHQRRAAEEAGQDQQVRQERQGLPDAAFRRRQILVIRAYGLIGHRTDAARQQTQGAGGAAVVFQ